MILFTACMVIFIIVILIKLNKSKKNLYKKPYEILNNTYDNLIVKIINIKNLEETKNIDLLISKNINELKKEINKINITSYKNIEEKKTITSIVSHLEKLILKLDNMQINESNYEEILNDLSYKVSNLKSKYTINNLYKPISNQLEINNIIDNLYYQRDNLNRLHINK